MHRDREAEGGDNPKLIWVLVPRRHGSGVLLGINGCVTGGYICVTLRQLKYPSADLLTVGYALTGQYWEQQRKEVQTRSCTILLE